MSQGYETILLALTGFLLTLQLGVLQ